MEQVSRDYEAGKWVPAYYGLKFSVARKGNRPECDLSVKVETLAKAQAEAARRNQVSA